jgi:hypothetical protein
MLGLVNVRYCKAPTMLQYFIPSLGPRGLLATSERGYVEASGVGADLHLRMTILSSNLFPV